VLLIWRFHTPFPVSEPAPAPVLEPQWQLSRTGRESSGAGFLVLTRLEAFLPLAVGMLVVATVSDAFRPALMVAVSHSSPSAVRKRSFALIRLAVGLGMAIGPAIAGLLAHTSSALLIAGDAVTCWAAAVILIARRNDNANAGASSGSTSRSLLY
jgi:MFS family permease